MSDDSPSPADDATVPSNIDSAAADESLVWYFRREKQAFGPVSFAQLRRRIAIGKLLRNDLVRRKDNDGWQRADAVPGLWQTEEEHKPEPAPRHAIMRETRADEDADTTPPQKARQPACSGAKKKQRVAVLALLAVAVVLPVVILVPTAIAVYMIHNHFNQDRPAAPVIAAVIPPPVAMVPKVPAPPAKVPAPMPVDIDKPEIQPAPPKGDPAKPDVLPEGAAGFVFMERPDAPAEIRPDHYYGILMREIARQSLLLAAREELGLTTRDALLGETPPAGMPEKNVLRVASLFQQDKALDIAMTNGPRANAALPTGQIWQARAPIGKLSYANLMLIAETHARSSMVDGLKRAGFTGKPNRYLPMDGATPDGIEDLLGQMTFTAQYQAVRELHALMHEKGESPGNLGALVRAYANLGVLTEFQWDSASKVFKARSLLYAGRLVGRLPKDASLGHWHLAYAYALTGLHTNALAEVNQAATLHKGGAGKEAKEPGFVPPPPWVEFIDAYSHFDTARLKKAAGKENPSRLAQLLWFFSIESYVCPQFTTTVGEAVLAANPECYRVHDGICRVGGLGVRQAATMQAPAVFAKHFPRRLAELPGVPPDIAKLAADAEPEPGMLRIVRTLRDAGNADLKSGEFSWAVLAHLARETHFAQVTQRLDFMRYMWTVPTAETANAMLPSVADHPYAPFIRTFTLDRFREVGKCQELLAQLPQSDLLPTQLGLLRAFEECKAPNLFRVQHLAIVRMDVIEYDVRLTAPRYHDQSSGILPLARNLLATSPYSPLARGLTVNSDWNTASKHADDWEMTAQHPQLLLHLGERYILLGRFDDAARCIERAIAISPEFKAYTLLADAYRNAKKMDQWQAALDRYLALNPPGLEPARVRVMIANELMRRKEWQKAKPYADAAAATGADWAMQCACACHEGLGEWEESEEWIRRSTERYETSYIRWFMWCKRTAHGDLAAATKVVTDRFQDVSQIAAPIDLQQMGFFYTLTGKPEQAMWAFKAWHKAEPTGDVSSLMLLLAHDENEEWELRDKILKNFPEGNGKSPLQWLPGLYRESLARGEKAKLDLVAADKQLAASPDKFQPVCAYFVGRFLEQHNQKADAIRYYRRCVDAPEVANVMFTTLAVDRLRVLGVKNAQRP